MDNDQRQEVGANPKAAFDLRTLIIQAAEREAPSGTPEVLASIEDAWAVGPTAEPDDPSVDLDDYRQEHEISSLRQQLQESIDTHTNRIAYIGRVFWLVVAWLACVVACVGLTGFAAWGFKLTDQVLIAFITSTTINVVGLFVVVAKWLYPSTNGVAKKSPAPRKKKPETKKNE